MLITAAIVLFVIVYLIYNAGSYCFLLGNRQLSRGNKQKAFSHFEFGCRYLRVNDSQKTMYAAMLLKDGQEDRAEKMLNLIISRPGIKDRDKYHAKGILALVYYKRGDLDAAIETTKNALKNCENTFHYGNLGYLYLAKGDLDQALEFNQKAYDYNSDDPLILDNLGDTYLRRGEYEKAEKIFQDLMEKRPRFPDAYYHYGQYLARKGCPGEALEQLNIALRFDFSYISPISRGQVEAEIDHILGLQGKNHED